MFNPQIIYYEKEILEYQLGKELMKKYKDTPKILIDNHNNIEELRKKPNSEFAKMKTNLNYTVLLHRITSHYISKLKLAYIKYIIWIIY